MLEGDSRRAPGNRSATLGRQLHGKMSAALGELIRPFTEEDMSLPDFELLVGFGALAWNRSFKEVRKPVELGSFFESLDDESRAWFEALVAKLEARKGRLFPKDDRMIASWDVSVLPDGSYYLVAASLGYE